MLTAQVQPCYLISRWKKFSVLQFFFFSNLSSLWCWQANGSRSSEKFNQLIHHHLPFKFTLIKWARPSATATAFWHWHISGSNSCISSICDHHRHRHCHHHHSDHYCLCVAVFVRAIYFLLLASSLCPARRHLEKDENLPVCSCCRAK